MVRVDCDDCSMNFQTKKLYIKHIKSKECSKSKRAATGSPTSSIHAEKRPRLEIIPQSNYSPSQIAALQSQISQLSQKQKEHLQIQLAQSTAKQRQALQNIPFNQLSDKQKNALKRLSPSPSSSSTSKVIITKNSDPKEIITSNFDGSVNDRSNFIFIVGLCWRFRDLIIIQSNGVIRELKV